MTLQKNGADSIRDQRGYSEIDKETAEQGAGFLKMTENILEFCVDHHRIDDEQDDKCDQNILWDRHAAPEIDICQTESDTHQDEIV